LFLLFGKKLIVLFLIIYLMNIKIKNRHRLKKRDEKNMKNQISHIYSSYFDFDKSSVETGELMGFKIILFDDVPCFFYYQKRIMITINGLFRFKPKENFVVVDMGAVKFVTNGADVMSPGIIDADVDIIEEDQVWICDEKHKKPLAVGIAIINGNRMKKENAGKAVKIVHYIGDNLWRAIDQIMQN